MWEMHFLQSRNVLMLKQPSCGRCPSHEIERWIPSIWIKERLSSIMVLFPEISYLFSSAFALIFIVPLFSFSPSSLFAVILTRMLIPPHPSSRHIPLISSLLDNTSLDLPVSPSYSFKSLNYLIILLLYINCLFPSN